MPMLAGTQNVVHNDSRDAGPASWHDEAPVVGFGSGENLMLNRSTGANRTGNPFGGALAGSSGVRWALLARRRLIASRHGGPGAADPDGCRPSRIYVIPSPS